MGHRYCQLAWYIRCGHASNHIKHVCMTVVQLQKSLTIWNCVQAKILLESAQSYILCTLKHGKVTKCVWLILCIFFTRIVIDPSTIDKFSDPDSSYDVAQQYINRAFRQWTHIEMVLVLLCSWILLDLTAAIFGVENICCVVGFSTRLGTV